MPDLICHRHASANQARAVACPASMANGVCEIAALLQEDFVEKARLCLADLIYLEIGRMPPSWLLSGRPAAGATH